MLVNYGGDVLELSSDLLKDFADVTDTPESKKNENNAYGTVSVQNEVIYVNFDGSSLLTPASSTVIVEDGDRVLVLTKGRSAVITGNLTSPSSGTPGGTSITIPQIVNTIYPVGAIYMSTNNVDPGVLFTNTTWVEWGAGRVPVGIDTNDSDFNTSEKTGGNKNLQQHSHVQSSNTGNSTAFDTPAIGSFTSGVGTLHSHTISHTHNLNGHTHDMTHHHSLLPNSGANLTRPASGSNFAVSASDRSYRASAVYTTVGNTDTTGAPSNNNTGVSSATTTGGEAAHTHSIPNHVHSVSAHSHTLGGNTGDTGVGTSQNLQPYITCYMWKRTA